VFRSRRRKFSRKNLSVLIREGRAGTAQFQGSVEKWTYLTVLRREGEKEERRSETRVFFTDTSINDVLLPYNNNRVNGYIF